MEDSVPASPPDRDTFHLVQYRWPTERTEQIRAAYPRHREDVDALGANGRLWMIGTLPDVDGTTAAVAIFRDADAAHAFRQHDPLFIDGLADAGPVQEWTPLSFPRP
jgi:uncharacterized protein YciI